MLQARIKKNGDINLGYAKKIEGAERTEGTKVRMTAIKKGPLGTPINIKEEILVKKEDLEEISRWKGAVLGPSQNTYPDPKIHTLKGVIKDKKLDRITTHDLGRAIRNNSRTKVTPRCKEAWGEKFTLNLPWLGIGKEFARNIGTTRDTGSWFKNILHRALWLKEGGARHKCSICADQYSLENWDHLWQCPKLKPTWDKFIQLANTTMGDQHTGHSQACIYLGVDGSGESLQGTLGLLHKLIWKFIIMDFTKASKEGTQMQTERIWRRATRRLATRVNAQGRIVQRRNLTTEGRGTQSSWDKLNKKLEPLAQVHSTSGEVHWHASIKEEWKELHILGEEEEQEEQEPSLDDPEDEGEDNREEEEMNSNSEEEEEVPDHRRDENSEY